MWVGRLGCETYTTGRDVRLGVVEGLQWFPPRNVHVWRATLHRVQWRINGEEGHAAGQLPPLVSINLASQHSPCSPYLNPQTSSAPTCPPSACPDSPNFASCAPRPHPGPLSTPCRSLPLPLVRFHPAQTLGHSPCDPPNVAERVSPHAGRPDLFPCATATIAAGSRQRRG